MNMMGLVVEVPSKTRAIAGAFVAVFVMMVSAVLYSLGVGGTMAAQFGAVGLLCSLITMVTMHRQPVRGTLICLVAGGVLWAVMQLVMGE